MRSIPFPEWPQALAQAQRPESFQHSAEITIRWYLSFCRRARAEVTVQSARDFVEWATKGKHPQAWQHSRTGTWAVAGPKARAASE